MKKSDGVSKNMFGIIDAIYLDQTSAFFDTLSDAEKKLYKTSRYMINRFISMNPAHAVAVNMIQKYTAMPDKMHYLFLSGVIPRKKEYNKYIKGAKDERYESWLLELVAKHYEVSTVEASQYLDILYKTNKPHLKELCSMYGIEPKLIKKLKL